MLSSTRAVTALDTPAAWQCHIALTSIWRVVVRSIGGMPRAAWANCSSFLPSVDGEVISRGANPDGSGISDSFDKKNGETVSVGAGASLLCRQRGDQHQQRQPDHQQATAFVGR